MSGELTWDHAVHDIPQAVCRPMRRATPEELAQIARALDLIACSSLSGDLHHHANRRRALPVCAAGSKPPLQQACVVTLEPVTEEIDETFDVAFWPEADIPPPASGEIELDDEPEIEPIVAGQIDVGRVVVRMPGRGHRSVPRKADAALDRVAASPRERPGRQTRKSLRGAGQDQGKRLIP